jgi:hypothetical protein
MTPAFGRLTILVCFAAAAAIPHDLLAQSPKQAAQTAPKPAQIDRNGVLILIRSALIALDQGNQTGNYTVLRDIGAPGFRTNTPARLSEIFAAQRRDNVDLSGVTVLDPQLSLLPQIESSGMLRMAGFFPSVPTQVNFELVFAPVDGQWRLFGISVNLGQATPSAPNPQAAAPTPPAAAPRPSPAKSAKPAAAAKSSPAPKPTPAAGKPPDSENPQ